MDFSKHPCFSAEARHTTGRIHLPVAPKCNIQCNFCNRKYDCVNESRPGVTSCILSPDQAVTYLREVDSRIKDLAVVGIAGPGDPFANPEETIATMEKVHQKFPDKILCLATNGLGLAEYVERISRVNVSHVTITMNAVDPEIGAQIYAWVRFGNRVMRGTEGAAFLLSRQTKAIKLLKEKGITVKINTVIIPGINDEHAEEVARYAAELGADVQNCIPLMHVEDTAFEGRKTPNAAEMQALRFATGKHLKQMSHCARCRADAVGKLGEANSKEIEQLLQNASRPKASADRPYIAVASREGLFVNCHLGEATQLWIFASEDGKISLRERRPTPVPGDGNVRWNNMADTLSDCFAILASGSGASPQKTLSERGITVVAAECLIRDAASPLFEGKPIPRALEKKTGTCASGAGCSGTGTGCA
ncbi:MAG: nitrogenase cofactor biosynthesis protein NifB [Spirochaetales bacterium]|nr:nitrogenase cofactor biosynthesis protein NifB [Spirochaetales bacterium]